jgi:hypothetical protein
MSNNNKLDWIAVVILMAIIGLTTYLIIVNGTG